MVSIRGLGKKFRFTQDTGFGTSATAQGKRLINNDGRFNVKRSGIPLFTRINTYHDMISIPWWLFHLLVLGAFVLINTIYTSIYLLVGTAELQGLAATSHWGKVFEVFTFSAQTLTTVGYGRISPLGAWAGAISSIEALTGIMMAAIITGLIFARFSRPKAKLLYSANALIAPYKTINALMFRIANARTNQLIECEGRLIFSFIEPETQLRRFINLPLEISKVNALALSWTLVHPIDEHSPLNDLQQSDLENALAEFIFSFKGFDDAYSQTVHTRHSYAYFDLVWGGKFVPMFHREEAGSGTVMEMDKIGAYIEVALNHKHAAAN